MLLGFRVLGLGFSGFRVFRVQGFQGLRCLGLRWLYGLNLLLRDFLSVLRFRVFRVWGF